ncbi:hypothetical protein D7030_01365 [Flavobacteriaceae bacterium AU392]|nr:hypothetical protein D1817_07820 [Flavobacteriaceae bacterium]RKM86528.1 hypothetical protein D7030_01365 [Flavobacteriaceae bacterium AU392]
MKDYNDILNNIDQLDLRKYPYDKLKELLRELDKFGVLLTTLHKGKKIIRGRLNNGNEVFDNTSKLSFKPEEFNTTYQRASTPNKSMFYGAIVPEGIGVDERIIERITVFGELAHSDTFLSDNSSVGEKKITFSRWDVLDDINLVSIIHHKKFERTPKLITELQEKYKDILSNDELKSRSLAISEFIGDIFAKETIKDDFDYMVSAVFSELACEKYDGVMYPSVRLAGEGMNVAIKPEALPKIKFVGSSECTIYKNEMEMIIGTDTRSVLGEDNNLTYYLDQNVSPDFMRKRVGLI